MQGFSPKIGSRKKGFSGAIQVVKPACPIDTLGNENGRFRSEHSVVIKDRPRLRGSP
jgi:hypothetical protein